MSASVVKASVRPILKIVTPTNNSVINPIRPVLKIVSPEENSVINHIRPILKIVTPEENSVINHIRPILKIVTPEENHSIKPINKIRKYTLPIFLERAKEIHGDKIDYSKITEKDINNGGRSKILLRCNICEYEWSISISSHIIDKNKCPDCSGRARWTFERFLKKAKEVHGDKIDYSQVRNEHIKGKESKVPLKCNICGYEWAPNISNHIRHKTGCPSCAGKAPWTLERFLKRAKEIHDDKIDYSQITEEDMKRGKDSFFLKLKCNLCEYEWSTSIGIHVNRGSGCPSCAGKAPWTLDRFIKKSKEIHGDKIDYSLVTEDNLKDHNGVETKIELICKDCDRTWFSSIRKNILRKKGCSKCVKKGYSKVAIDWLKSIEEAEGIVIQCATSPEGEFVLPSPNGGYYRLDGFCHETQVVYEFYGSYWHGNPRKYDPDKMNKTVGKTFGELYRRTIEKEEYIRSLGYKLVVKWETPIDDTDQ